MKRTILPAILLLLAACALPAVDLEIGLFYGGRSVASADVRDAFGNGAVYFPCAALRFGKGFSAGLGYEGGYDRDGVVGLYEEKASLKVAGWLLFAGYEKTFKKLTPYARLGWGFFSYRQTVESPFEQKVDDSASGLALAAGLRYRIAKGFFAAADLRYGMLKVKPIDIEVDLGGLRYSLGVGYIFNL
jgi:opacity protein-like surface antigen